MSDKELQEVVDTLEKFNIISFSEEGDIVGFTKDYRDTISIILAKSGNTTILTMAAASDNILKAALGDGFEELSLGYRASFATLLAHLGKHEYFTSPEPKWLSDELIHDMAIYIDCLQDAYAEDVKNEAAGKKD